MSTVTVRPISPTLFWKVARTALGRLACTYNDPTGGDYPHDHQLCLHDDEAIVAELLLRVAAAVASGDETAMIDTLDVLNDCMERT